LTQLLLLCFIVCASTMRGQVVIGNSPTPHVQDAYDRDKTRSQSNLSSAFTKQAPLGMLGPFGIRPHFNYSVIYGDGLLSVPGEPTNSTMQTASAGMLVELGRYWVVDYTHSNTFYSSRLLANSSGDSASLSGGNSYEDLSWGFTQTYSSSSQILAETGRQTNQENYSSGLNFSYELGDRTRLSLGGTRSVRLAAPSVRASTWTGSDWVQWSGSAGLQYAITSRLSFGVSMGFGYDELSGTNDMNSTRPQMNLSWRPTDKISVTINRGVERRKIQGENSDYVTNPIYSGSLTYQPLPTTTFSGSATRNISASYFDNQITRNIQWSAGVEQRLLQRYYLSGTVTEGRTAYISTNNEIAGRDDKFESFQAQLSTRVLRRGSIGLTYDVSENFSSVTGFTFKSHQIGCIIGYRF
jgi:hypothetical protein